MPTDTLSIHDSVALARRFPLGAASTAKPATWEIAALAAIGVAAGLATSYVKLNLGIAGHAILLSVLPIALGVSVVPRRFAGSLVSGSSALVMVIAAHTGLGAVGSMLATGVFLDIALRKVRPGLGLHGAFLLAGLGGNAVAWGARALTKITGLESGIVSFSQWWASSLVSYALCGALAGLVSATLLFRTGGKRAVSGA